MDDIYARLARHMDSLPGGFPPTDSGVELRILRRLFTREEAELAVHISLIPEQARVIARRAGITREAAARRLPDMARKGLTIALVAEDQATQYAAAQFVIGIWEFHVNDLDPGLIHDFDEYMPALFREAWKVPQLRTIPVNRSLDHQMTILHYERAEELVRRARKIVVAPCICRRERHMDGHGCGRISEACLVFDMGADLYERNGLGRLIQREEALNILTRADEAGLVLQPGNSQEPANICCCCGCCCGVLRSIKAYPKPASLMSSPFMVSFAPEICSDCGTCMTRCQMEALQAQAGKTVLVADRCIGCGLCVSTCPTGSLTLTRKADIEQPQVPKDSIRSMLQLGKARGRIGAVDLAWMALKSKMERLLTLR